MAYQWGEFLQLASELAKLPSPILPQLASHRSAISRAYYFSFHTVMEFAYTHGYDRQDLKNKKCNTVAVPKAQIAEDHSLIFDYLQGLLLLALSKESREHVLAINSALSGLKDDRQISDYKDHDPIEFPGKAQGAISSAETIRDAILELIRLNEIPLKTIKQDR